MLRKKCQRCGQHSFSASDGPNWKCPACGANMYNQPAVPAGRGEMKLLEIARRISNVKH